MGFEDRPHRKNQVIERTELSPYQLDQYYGKDKLATLEALYTDMFSHSRKKPTLGEVCEEWLTIRNADDDVSASTEQHDHEYYNIVIKPDPISKRPQSVEWMR